MMRFLTKTRSKKIDDSSILEIKEELASLKNQVANQKKTISEYAKALRETSLALENLCFEMTLIGKWVAEKAAAEDAENELATAFGVSKSDDDEYLN